MRVSVFQQRHNTKADPKSACGLYVNVNGEQSRDTPVNFVGSAISATIDLPYLLLFHADFLEIRHAESGELCQVIAGQDIYCTLNVQPGVDEPRVLMSMIHSEDEDHQVILELIGHPSSRLSSCVPRISS